MLSRWIIRFAGISTICLAMCAAASAQYGGGGGKGGSGGTGGAGGETSPAGGEKFWKKNWNWGGGAGGAARWIPLFLRHPPPPADKKKTSFTSCTHAL